MRKLAIKTMFFILIFSLFNSQEKENMDIKSKIELQNIEGLYNIKAIAKNNSKLYMSLTYNLLTLKKGKTGNLSSSRQSGRFTIEPSETKKLSESSVNLDKEDALKIYLLINDEKSGKLITKDSIEINSANFTGVFNTKEENSKEEDIVLEGFTIDETKTRIGEQFYSKLFTHMQINDIKFSFITRIIELPTSSRNTQIQVHAEDSVIFTFNAYPDEDMLDSAVRETLQLLFNYQKQKEVSEKNFMY